MERLWADNARNENACIIQKNVGLREGSLLRASIAFGSPHSGPPMQLVGAYPEPPYKKKECDAMRKRNVTITIRCTEDERQRIYNKAHRHGLTLSDFVLRSALGKKIVTADGLADVLKEQKSIGRNLNQIAMLGNMGRLKSVRLDELVAQHERATAALCEIAKEMK